MKKLAFCLAALGLLVMAGGAAAEICTIDDVPAATLLLPYFETDWTTTDGINTLFTINNASASATLAHVTLWTDESVPTLDFDVYLTGYDVQSINLRDIFNGILPRTASAGQDPGDVVSPKGPLSQDINFASCANLPYNNPAISAALLAHIRASHTGQASAIYGGCLGLSYGDGIARGYITVDVSNQCNLEFPNSQGYFSSGGQGLAGNRNILWGDYIYVDPANNFAQGETLVHIEAQTGGFTTGDYTFYGRYVGGTAVDEREPLSSMFASRYILSGLFDGGTDLIVWRDSKTDTASSHSCGGSFSWFPLNQTDVVAFDEQENPADLCFRGDNISPPTGGADTCFPAEAQRVNLANSNVPGGATPNPPFDFGWIYLNLNTSVTGGLFNPTAQAWVTTVMNASGRFSVGYDAIQLDSVCDTNGTSGISLIP